MRWTFLVAASLLTLAPLAASAPGLDQPTQQALLAALDDERHNQAIYGAVIERFPDAMPFSHIVGSEQRHISHLMPLFEKHGLAIPANPWAGKTLEIPASLTDACKAAVESERKNAALYDQLLAQATDAEVQEVFGWLRSASLERHLPAFERCATGAASGGPGAMMGGRGCPHGDKMAGNGPGGGPGHGPGMGQGRGQGMGPMGQGMGMGKGMGQGMRHGPDGGAAGCGCPCCAAHGGG